MCSKYKKKFNGNNTGNKDRTVLLMVFFESYWDTLTNHCDGDFLLFVRILIMASYFDPEIERPAVTFLKRINLQWTGLMSEVSNKLCPTPILLHRFRLLWVINEFIWFPEPHPGELSDCPPWIRIVIWAGDHHTGSRETFNWGWHLNCPRWSFSLRNWNKTVSKM